MSTTVRIREEDKERLRRLQAAWRNTRGETPPQQELLGRGLEYLERHAQEVLAEAAWRPLSRDEFRSLRTRLQGHYGGGLSEDIDDAVYGEES